MTGLVLGMLVSTANSSYQDQKNELAEMGSNFVEVDRLLASYGPETQAVREELRGLAESSLERIWPSAVRQQAQLRPKGNSQLLYDQLQALVPKNDTQAAAKSSAITMAVGLRRTYWLMFLKSEQNSLSMPLLVVVVSWLTAIFISCGLFAPRNSTVIVSLALCAFAISAAVFVIMAMYTPYSGVMKISSFPIRDALRQMAP
ncbi:MAG: hypothetical protein WA426_00800 [Silvibacterium sp.]